MNLKVVVYHLDLIRVLCYVLDADPSALLLYVHVC